MRWKQGVSQAVRTGKNSKPQCSSHVGLLSATGIHHASSHLSVCKVQVSILPQPNWSLWQPPLFSSSWVRNLCVINFL